MSSRPLTASLHTVTAVSRVAALLARQSIAAGHTLPANAAELFTAGALVTLGYSAEAVDVERVIEWDLSTAPLLAKCIEATRKALA